MKIGKYMEYMEKCIWYIEEKKTQWNLALSEQFILEANVNNVRKMVMNVMTW